jgi:hypothetical protein
MALRANDLNQSYLRHHPPGFIGLCSLLREDHPGENQENHGNLPGLHKHFQYCVQCRYLMPMERQGQWQVPAAPTAGNDHIGHTAPEIDDLDQHP